LGSHALSRCAAPVALLALAVLAWTCRAPSRTSSDAPLRSTGNACAPRQYSDKELLKIVDDEIVKRRGSLVSAFRTEVSIKRSGCEYLIGIEDIPAHPGGVLRVRIDEEGKVVEFVPGL